MRFKVTGADATTGKEAEETVDAVSAEHAEYLARQRGILIAEVVQLAPSEPLPPPTTTAPLPTPTLEIAVPEYAEIKKFATGMRDGGQFVILLSWCAFAWWLSGELMGLLAPGEDDLMSRIEASNVQERWTWGMILMLIGFLMKGSSHLINAFRDLVRNSYHTADNKAPKV